MALIKVQKQTVWKWQALANLTLGGLGTGLYLVSLVLIIPTAPDWIQSLAETASPKLLGPVLVGIGLLALTTEAGKPIHSVYLLSNLRQSWMSREALAGLVFIAAAGLDWLFPHPALRTIAALAAIGFMVSQGFILSRARGVPAWNRSLMPVLFATSGFVTGIGLALVVFPVQKSGVGSMVYTLVSLELLGILAAILNLIVWQLYLDTQEDEFRQTTGALRNTGNTFWFVGVGHVLPILLLLFSLLALNGISQSVVNMVSGVALISGGAAQKWAVMFSASYLKRTWPFLD